LFDDIFSDAFRFLDYTLPAAPRQIRELSASNFPPADIIVNPDKTYQVNVALAGVPEEAIKIDLEGNYVKLTVDTRQDVPAEGERADGANEEEAKTPTKVQSGIRDFTFLETSYAIPKYWDKDTLKASYKNGMLTIKVEPKAEVKQLSEKRSIPLIAE
jgi:HSP20 family molecular chaperone IbpA